MQPDVHPYPELPWPGNTNSRWWNFSVPNNVTDHPILHSICVVLILYNRDGMKMEELMCVNLLGIDALIRWGFWTEGKHCWARQQGNTTRWLAGDENAYSYSYSGWPHQLKLNQPSIKLKSMRCVCIAVMNVGGGWGLPLLDLEYSMLGGCVVVEWF